ncbi:BnaC04g11780D [Brassica napus]|uniref:BnaC04g11780D protein n=1 Tax=Brassica napus TaxID=3708 RepID=A0A078FJ53_BRANA|nr:BnaC04g11780D [Brassica napus]
MFYLIPRLKQNRK